MQEPGMQLHIDPMKDGSPVICEECHDEKGYWENKLTIRKISALQSPSGKEMFIQIPIMVCENCGAHFPAASPFAASRNA